LFEEFEGFISGIPQVGEEMGIAVDIETVGIIQQYLPSFRFLFKIFSIQLQWNIVFDGGLDDFERIRFFKSNTNMSDAVYFIAVSFDGINKTIGNFFRSAFENFFMIGQDDEVTFDAVNLHADIPGFIQQIGFHPENNFDIIVNILPAFARRPVGFL
jgi:hypothetical protein